MSSPFYVTNGLRTQVYLSFNIPISRTLIPTIHVANSSDFFPYLSVKVNVYIRYVNETVVWCINPVLNSSCQPAGNNFIIIIMWLKDPSKLQESFVFILHASHYIHC